MADIYDQIYSVDSLSVGWYGTEYQSRPIDLGFDPSYFVESQNERSHFEYTIHALMKQWLDEVVNISSTHQMVSHPAYLQIIALGQRALPFLFLELSKSPNHWFTALEAITQSNPVPENERGDIIAMRDRWIGWAEAEGYN